MATASADLAPSCKIVIKAANQKYEDFNVDIPETDWTIKQLKQHLTDNYPSNPACESIRLIYSGKLLHDHWTLKECLRQNLQTSHIIHIVLPASSNNSNTAGTKAASPGPRASSSATDEHYQPHLDDELTPGSSSNSDDASSTSSSDSPTPVRQQSGSESVTAAAANPLNTFNQLQSNLNNLIQQQQRRQQQQQAQQQYEQLSAKEQYNMVHANLLRYYESSMGVSVQSNAWYSAYIQHLALYNYMYTNYLQSIGIIGSPMSPAATATNSTHETATHHHDRPAGADLQQGQQEAPAPAPAPAARPAPPPPAAAALGGAAAQQDMGDREDDWLGILHNICSFLILFSIIYYYSSFERFVLIFSIVFILILYHKGWLTLQRRPAANLANRRNAAPANRPAQEGQPPNNEADPAADAAAQAPPPPPPAPVNPGTLRLILTFVFTFFTSLVPERPQAAG